ncbi:hypothetical protein LPB140_07515 [Sphingorhabdus lutea]|uniref:Uncharacterized protein n=1 Tax=Sphingorhabdus lutea TaxID=1913578 RepID=A0A1L3JC01_9SPHN|nr:hypothetical protein [Sphingorhabdus lutea]APG62660.1 hypothetical protein LPB140_07515 [Sphingorhabdus lutea]
MLDDQGFYYLMALTIFASILTISIFMLRAWRDWIAFRQNEIDAQNNHIGFDKPMSLIEVADLKERVKKLEAIASGVDI